MAQIAPEKPTVEELERMFPMDPVTAENIAEARKRASNVIRGDVLGFIGTQGPCAATLETDDSGELYADQEGDQLREIESTRPGLVLLNRKPVWKPRTDPDQWHGVETEPDTVVPAYGLIASGGRKAANVAIEIGHKYHIRRYGQWLSFAWNGGRSIDDRELVEAVATELPDLPYGIKNGLDGEIDMALQHVDLVHQLRGITGAPAILIYRGGTNAKNPDDWEKQYRRALEITEGKMIVDPAHGGEMAHDPDGKFQKSIVGQIACLNSVIRIGADYGELPLGVMIEASGAHSPTDPVMPPDVALNGILQLYDMKLSTLNITKA